MSQQQQRQHNRRLTPHTTRDERAHSLLPCLSVTGRGGRGGRGGHAGGDGSSGHATLELSGLPPNSDYPSMVSFLNSHAPQGFRFIKLQVGGGTARMTLAASDVPSVVSALSGQHVAPGFPLTIEMGAQAGRPLNNQEKQALQTMVRNSYDARGKVLDLSSIAQKGNFNFVNFHSNNFTSELFNAIQQAAPDAISINLASNQIQTLTCFQGMIRAVPQLQNLSLQNNQIGKSVAHVFTPTADDASLN
jgi:hypothetical protein